MEGITTGFVLFLVKNTFVAVAISIALFKLYPTKAFVISLLATPIVIQMVSFVELASVDEGFAARLLLSFILAWPVIAIVENQIKRSST